MITIPEKNYSKSQKSITGKILKRSSTEGIRTSVSRQIEWNDEWAFKPNWGYDFEFISANTEPGVIIGKLTGRYNVVGDNFECEVELFNHQWSQFGIPVRYLDWKTPILKGFFEDVDYTLLDDDGTVTGIVYKDHNSRDASGSLFPYFDPDYLLYSDPEKWDKYFNSPDWTKGKEFISYDHKIERLKEVGTLNSLTAKSMELINIKPHWNGGCLLDWGLCLSAQNSNPDINDIFIESIGDKRTFSPRGELRIYGLTPDTQYYARLWHKREGNSAEPAEVEYYSEAMIIRTNAQLRDPQLVIGAVTYHLTATSAEIRIGFDWIGDHEILEAGLCWATSSEPTPNDNKLTIEERDELSTVFLNLVNLQPSTMYYVRTYVILADRIVYGTPDLQVAPIRNYAYRHPGFFTTLNLEVPVLPTVDMLRKFNIYDKSAIASAKILTTGGGVIISAGLCWGKTSVPTKDDQFAEADLSRGTFEEFYVDLMNLDPASTYYIRAWATSSVGTAYSSNEVVIQTSEGIPSVLTLETSTVTEITTTSAKAGGYLSDAGGMQIAERGICLKHEITTGPATIDDVKIPHQSSGVGMFEINVTTLTIDTSYKIRSYVIADGAVYYGNEIVFRTLKVEATYKPSVITNEVKEIQATKAVFSGNVVSDGGSLIVRKGIAWSRSTIKATSLPVNDYVDIAGVDFETVITGLSGDTLYQARAYAINANGISWGNQVEFKTLAEKAVEFAQIEVAQVSQLTNSEATISVKISNDGGGLISRAGITWSTESIAAVGDPVMPYLDNDYLSTSFSKRLPGLQANTKYYYRAYAVNAAGISWSAQGEFTTLSSQLARVTVNSEVIEELTNSMKIAVSFGDDEQSAITDKGIMWGFGPQKLINRISYGSGRDSFTGILTQYSSGQYYVRAYAENALGIHYSKQIHELKIDNSDNTRFSIPTDTNISTFSFKARTWIKNKYGWELHRSDQNNIVLNTPEKNNTSEKVLSQAAKPLINTPAMNIEDPLVFDVLETKKMSTRTVKWVTRQGIPTLIMHFSEQVKFTLPQETINIKCGDVIIEDVTLYPLIGNDYVILYNNVLPSNPLIDEAVIKGTVIELTSASEASKRLLIPRENAKLRAQDIENYIPGEVSPGILDSKADHGYLEGEIPKTLKQIEVGVGAMANTVGGFPVISPEGKIPIEVIPSLQEVFSARQNFNDFTGSAIEITVDSLPELHDGIFIYVNGSLLTPGKDYTIAADTISLEQAIVDPADVCVIWFLDRHEYYGRPPSRINDLSIALISSKSIMLQFSAGGAHGNQALCEKYRVYYSNVEITSENYLSAKYVDITENIMPYGTAMSCIISGLDSGKIHYFAVAGFANNRFGLLSNVAMAKTDDIYMPSTVGYILPVTKFDVYDFLHHLKEVPHEDGGAPGDYYKVEYMVNGSVIENNGVAHEDSDVGPRMFAMTYTGFKNTWPNYTPYELIIDLGEVKRVDKVFIYYDKIVDYIHIWTSSLGANFAHAATVSGYETQKQWLTISIPEAYKYAKYIRLTFPSEVAIREFAAYGATLQSNLPTGRKIGGLLPRRRFEFFAGTNAFFTNLISDVAHFGRRVRFYSNWEWFPTMEQTVQAGIKLYGDTSGNGQISYRFSNNRVQGNLDEKLYEYKQLLNTKYGVSDTSTYMCFKAAMPFQWLDSNGNVQPFSLVGNNRMQDKSVYPEYDSRSPWAYRMYSQFLFTVAARYGRATGIAENLLAVDPSNTKLQGMDLLKYIELENEPDRNWNESPDTYYHPEELAAMVSACYDGHMGQLGPGFGIKQADPTMKVVLPGLKSQNSGYIKRMMIWFESNRTDPGYEVYPFDVMAFHYYHNTAGGQTNAASRKGISPDSIKPNKAMDDGGTLYDTMKYIADWRDREMPHLELWIGEFGYDEHPQSLQSVSEQAGKTLGQLKADFIMRSYMHIVASGIDAAQQYMYRNDTQQSLLMSVSYQNTYLGSGFVDYINSDRDENGEFYSDDNPAKYPPLASYYYIRNLIHHLIGMKFSHILRIANKTHVGGILINADEQDPVLKNICGIAFSPDQDDPSITKTPCIVLWLGQEAAANTVAHVVVDPSALEVRMTSFNNSESAPSAYGTDTILTPSAGPEGKFVQVPISGTPCILWTSYIGTKRIEPPVLNAYVVNSSTARLFWTDKNEKDYAIVIYKYDDSLGMYEEIYNQMTTSQEYDVSGLAPAQSHKFIAKFVDVTDMSLPESDYSEVVEFTTPSLLPLVTNVQPGAISFNRLAFTWEYDSQFESITEGFNIYRSSTPTGTYSLIAQIARELREFTNYGLEEGTTYYYKIEPYSSIASGTTTGYIGVTTLEENNQPPVVLSAMTDYFGEKIILQFNMPLGTSIAIGPNITVYDSNNGSPRTIAVGSFEYLPDPMKLVITLYDKILYSDSTILIGYDGNGTLSSAYGVPVEQFVDMAVTNRIASAALISRKVRISLNRPVGTGPEYTPFNVPSGNNTWNQLSTAGVSISNPYDASGGVTEFVVSKPKTSPAWGSEIVANRVTSDPDVEYVTSRSFAAGDFETWVNGVGGNVGQWTPASALSQEVAFHNLRADKDYYAEYIITTVSPTNDDHVFAEEFINHIAQRVLNVKNNTSIYRTGKITPIVCPSALVNQNIPLFDTPSAFVGFRSVLGDGTAKASSRLTGIILIEVNRE